MSFGFGVGDFITVSALALSLYRSFRSAPKEFQEISRQLESLHIVLVDLNDQSKESGSLLNRQGAMRQSELNSIGKNLRDTMEELENIYNRYQKMGRISWARVELGQKDLAAVRGKLTLHLAALNAFMASLTIGALGRMEPLLLKIHQLLEERARENEVMAQTILSITSDVTDYQAWGRIRMELRTEGIPDDYLRQNEQQIIEVARSIVDANNLLGDEFSYETDDDGPSPSDSVSQVWSSIHNQGLPPTDMAGARKNSPVSKGIDIKDLPLSPSVTIPEEPTKVSGPNTRDPNSAASALPYTTSNTHTRAIGRTDLSQSPSKWVQSLTPEQEKTRILLMNHGFDLRVAPKKPPSLVRVGRTQLWIPVPWRRMINNRFKTAEQRAWDWAVKNNDIIAAHLILDRYGHLNLSKLQAAEEGKWNFVKSCVLASKNPFEYKLCHLAARFNRADILTALAEKGKDMLRQGTLPLSEIDKSVSKSNELIRYRARFTPLQTAALYGSVDAARFLIDNGINVDDHVFDHSGRTSILTPLQLACGVSFKMDEDWTMIERTIELFIHRGASVNTPRKYEHSPLYFVINRNLYRPFKDLLEYGASIRPYSSFERNASHRISYLHEAAKQSDHRFVELLLDRGADINFRCEYEFYSVGTPIMVACRSKNWEVARYLRNRGANLEGMSEEKTAFIDRVSANEANDN